MKQSSLRKTITIGAVVGLALLVELHPLSAEDTAPQPASLRVALVQFDAVPGEVEKNLTAMERLTKEAVHGDARLVMFHELATTDYMRDMQSLAEAVPDGPSCRRMGRLAKQLDCYIAFGMPEKEAGRLYITQVFLGPKGFIQRYRKTWLFKTDEDRGFRNEWARYDPGTGPQIFEIEGIRATCLICADASSPRCIDRIEALKPQLVFFPVNRGATSFPNYPKRVAQFGAVTLVTNRVGKSYHRNCVGGATVFDKTGMILAQANRNHAEEILYFDFKLPQ